MDSVVDLPNPGLLALVAMPLIGPFVVGVGLSAFAGIGFLPAIIGGYVLSLAAAPVAAFLANTVIGRRTHSLRTVLHSKADVQPS